MALKQKIQVEDIAQEYASRSLPITSAHIDTNSNKTTWYLGGMNLNVRVFATEFSGMTKFTVVFERRDEEVVAEISFVGADARAMAKGIAGVVDQIHINDLEELAAK